ncbi:methionine--tRNA ligase [Candidatus Bathyarchaeota archaeon]|jgi:methionyl-tRNA synthetase|nr:methionine--tRNA ligase [Candidatus Bathyarchaeota archaeon]
MNQRCYKLNKNESHKYPVEEKVLVTCGLPYANGPLHIAHLRTYVPGDIFVRFLRKLGQDVVFVCGSDTHGTPITVKAEEMGITPREVVEIYHKHYIDIFPELGINFDNYGSTDHPLNHHRTQQIAKELMKNGYIYPKVVTLPYCPSCDRFLPDRYLEGKCPHCGVTARGDECDQGCNRYLEPGELQDPHCKICGTPAEFKETNQYFLKLTAFEDFLREFLEKLDGTDIAKNYAKQWLEGGLKDWNITRNIDWGIKFPGSKDLVLYVWFDAPIGYIQSTEEWAERTGGDWEHYWKGPGKLIHFIGPGIVYHHCLFWPSMLHGSDYSVPDVIVASGTMKVEGHVFSKSRGYVIWVYDDYLVNDLDPDVLRYYIASYTGQQRDLDFSWETYGEKVNKELVGSLGNFIYRSMLFAYRNYKELPKGNVEPEVRDQVERALDVIRDGVDEYEFKKVSDAILGLADFGNKYIQKNEPWKIDKTDPERARDIIHNVVWLTKALAVFVEPIMPNKSKEIWNQLGNPSENVPLYEALAPLEAGRKIEKPEPLFDQIPEEEIAALTEAMVRRIYSAKG